MEEGEVMPTCNQEVRPAVVVIVCRGGTMCVKIDLIETHFGGDIFKAEVTEVAIEAAGVALDLVLVWSLVMAAARDEKVEQAIAVKIEYSQATAQ